MCRHLAYLGSPIALDALLLQPERSLLRQSYEPRHQVSGVVNADGFGAGWYDHAIRPEPARYRSDRPIWTDRSFASLAGLVHSGAVLAAVRSATPGFPVEESGAAPFTAGPWLFSHNGIVEGFAAGIGVELRASVSDARAAAIEGHTDSEVLFALTLDQLDGGATPGAALGAVVKAVDARTNGRFNLLLTDGNRVAATAWGDSLFVRRSSAATIIASEPTDAAPEWQRVPDRSLIEGDAAEVLVAAL
jgi:gamma-glutamyl hercynylcysteine S-oxide hydrolase